MNSDDQLRRELLDRIRAKRAAINAFIHDLEPRGERQVNVSIICSAVAAVLTAGPALGGTSFTSAVQHSLATGDDSVVWRVLCLAAVIVSTTAAVSTNLYKSHDVAGRLGKAEACSVGLEGLETLVEFEELPVSKAAQLYQQYVTGVPFIQDKV
jgi:hypothetical protein